MGHMTTESRILAVLYILESVRKFIATHLVASKIMCGIGSGAFLSRSKKQIVTTESSTVAEFIATHLVAKDFFGARSLLGEMGHTHVSPTIL